MTDTTTMKKFRSPPYPAHPLPKAIERARQLYAKAQHHEVGIPVLADAWGFGEKSSGLWATAAALIHYGLLTGHGSGKARKFKLTDIAHRIIRDVDPDSTKRQDAIKRAALAPTVHGEIWEQYKTAHGLSDAVLKNFLTFDRLEAGKAPFSDQAADEVIRTYRETILFAGLDASGAVSEGGEDTGDAEINNHTSDHLPPPPLDRNEVRRTKIMDGERELTTGLLSKDASFRLIVSGSIGVRELERLIAKLELDKEILADADDQDETE